MPPLRGAEARSRMDQSSPGTALVFWLYFAWFVQQESHYFRPLMNPYISLPFHSLWALISIVSVISKQRDIKGFSPSAVWNVAPAPSFSGACGSPGPLRSTFPRALFLWELCTAHSLFETSLQENQSSFFLLILSFQKVMVSRKARLGAF